MEMELENPSDGEKRASANACNGDSSDPPHASGCFTDDMDSACSTPYVSAPSSPGRGGPSGYFYSAPASPMHFVLSSSPYGYAGAGDGGVNAAADGLMSGSFEFDFSARFGGTGSGAAAAWSMISADELFLNGQIRPMNLSSHLQRPQVLAPLLDLDGEEDEDGSDRNEASTLRGRDLKMRNRSLRRRARSMSPLRNAAPFQWHNEGEDLDERSGKRSSTEKGEDVDDLETEPDHMDQLAAAATPSVSASSSRSSSTSSSRSSKRWVFLKDLLYRSKSEGRGNTKDKFWNAISFSPSKDRSSSLFFRDRFTRPPPPPAPDAPPSTTAAAASSAPSKIGKPKQKNAGSSASASTSKKPSSASSKPANGVGKRRVPSQSPHERHYTANRVQAEEMRKKTFLPYRQGLLGCLWFSSRSYGAMNGLARTLNPVSSR